MKKYIFRLLIIIFLLLFYILLFTNNVYSATSFEIAIFNDAVERAKSRNYDTSNYVIIKSPDSGDYNIFFVNDITRTHWNSHLNCLYSYGNLFFYENNKLDSGRQIELGGYNNYCGGIPVFSSFDLYTGDNGSGELILKKTLVTLNYEVHASYTDYTSNPITLYTNYFDYEDREKYRVDISTDLETWVTMNYETMHFAEENVTKFRFNYKINQNGIYYFKFINLETSEEQYITFNVKNIVRNPNTGIDINNDVPTPYITYKRLLDNFIFSTQSFEFERFKNLECLYMKNEFIEDYSLWNKMDLASMTNSTLGTTEYNFTFSVPRDSEDCTYYFIFYDISLQKYSSISSLDCHFDYMNEYCDKVLGVVEDNKNDMNSLKGYFSERFGFLTYPFEFISDLLNRVLNIEYKEPIIHIPQLIIPDTDIVIFEGYDYNLNSLLENNVVSNIYNIYLIAVDFIIIISFLIGAKNVFEEVMNG